MTYQFRVLLRRLIGKVGMNYGTVCTEEAVAAYMQVYQSGTCYLWKMVADTSRLSHGDNENFSN